MDSSIYRLRPVDVLCLCVLGLLFLGALMVQSAAMRVNTSSDSQLTPQFTQAAQPAPFGWTSRGYKHLQFAGAAIVTFFIIGRINYRRLVRPDQSIWKNIITWAMLLAMFTCVIVLIPHIGISVNGARRWLPLGFAQLQPSELAKWTSVIFLAYWLAYPPVDLDKFFKGFLPTLVPIGIICLLIVIQDLGTAALIALCALTMMLVGRVKLRHLLIVIPPVLAMGLWFLRHKTYRWNRVIAFIDPFAAPQGDGYHMIQSLLSFSTGGIWGRGLGNGIQKLGYLPEDTTDFIFAVVCEELGLMGAMLTVLLYLGILWVSWQAVKKKTDDFGRLLAFGIGSMLSLQAIINIAVATVSMPTKGLSLPLVSAGGSGLVITCTALGLLLSATRYVEEPLAQATDESNPSENSPVPASIQIIGPITENTPIVPAPLVA